MSGPERPEADVLAELRFALEEGRAESPPPDLLDGVLRRALAERAAGAPTDRPERVPGVEVFRGGVADLDALLGDLDGAEWSRPALRDLDVQGLVGHLIGVETGFLAALDAAEGPAITDPQPTDHISSTDPYARAQMGRPPGATLEEWRDVTARAAARAAALPADRTVDFYGVSLPLDHLLVIRAFEMWIHEEDVRRATGRPLSAPAAGRLARMAELAVQLLPAGMSRVGRQRPGRCVRLVLTGAGGGTWDVGAGSDSLRSARIVVDTAAFCRIVGNRLDPAAAGPWLDGDETLAADLFAGAAALALD